MVTVGKLSGGYRHQDRRPSRESDRGVSDDQEWERDVTTGHVRVKGTQTVNTNRVVPSIIWLSAKPGRLANLQMRLISLHPPTTIRYRDFRRSAALFCEAAGIPRSRYSYYLGHGHHDVTGFTSAALRQVHNLTPTVQEL